MDERILAVVERWAGCTIDDATLLDGGEVGTVRRLDLADGRRVVVKTGPTDPDVEAGMLRHLREAGGPRMPAVRHAGDGVLVLEHVPNDGDAAVTPAVERDLAERLAALHATTPDADAFGFPFDTLTGPYTQPNPWTDSWPTFFGEHRLAHAATRAHEEGVLPATDRGRIESLVADLPALLGHEPTPSLIHGDVWRGNVLIADGALATLLDPACYYADPEVELAYVEWTGTGGDAFLDRYREVAGIADGYRDREPTYRLYPLLTHLRYFGDEYLDDVRATLSALGY
ncbi:fructosamine kinase family protein [Halobaculum rubrum]|uniref:fructosamine kinase family protein n=1 Tax=Halobaculum rubrum TaxID=2872158 RepID=UPI001CA3B78F|nr:fructosamine kinase family protein [Halobaculum rubrum]QZY00549.1 fructosamine kinase family protein [Halobaculum rubrum]